MSQPPSPFKPYGSGDSSPDAKTQRIPRDQIDAGGSPGDDMRDASSAGWRSNRHRPTGTTRTGGLVPDQQRIMGWVDRGGWKILGAMGAVVVILLIVFLSSNTPQTPTPDETNQGAFVPTPTGSFDNSNPGTIIQGDSNATPVTPVDQQPPPQTGPQRLIVVGTGTEGLFMRDVPGGTILMTLPEGSTVEKIGEQQNPDRLWINIRDPQSGLQGWSASDFLQPAP